MNKTYSIYIITNNKNGTLYTGFSSGLKKRVYAHKHKLIDGFSKEHNLSKLVYYESTEDVKAAIAREKQIKKWKRQWKINAIEKDNPDWDDLYDDLVE
jgi:putative endonuclease